MQSTRKALARWLAGGAFLALSLTPATAMAESVQVVLNGRPLSFDVPPAVEDGVTMVPVRAVLAPLGATFTWTAESRTVTAALDGIQVQAVVGSPTAHVDGQPVPMMRPVQLVEGRTLIPLRFFAEQLGFQVHWDGGSRTVFLAAGGADRSEAVSREAARRRSDVALARAQQLIGTAYAWGGSSPEAGFDCSGLLLYVATQVGVDLPRTSFEQFEAGIAVERADLAPGDLVFFTTYAEGASHVGIYDGRGGFVHAQSPEVGVVRTSLENPWWAARYLGARRVFR
ncbi:MAG: stalk domain-containing protein [Bacillota bacterium]